MKEAWNHSLMDIHQISICIMKYFRSVLKFPIFLKNEIVIYYKFENCSWRKEEWMWRWQIIQGRVLIIIMIQNHRLEASDLVLCILIIYIYMLTLSLYISISISVKGFFFCITLGYFEFYLFRLLGFSWMITSTTTSFAPSPSLNMILICLVSWIPYLNVTLRQE